MLRPLALRLVTRAQGAYRGSLPFGLGDWSAEADAIAVLLEAPEDDALDAIAVAAQIPQAQGLPPATAVFVLGSAVRPSRGWFSRLYARRLKVARAPRSDAILMRGYVDLGAGVDESSGADLVWGFSSLCRVDRPASWPSPRVRASIR
jgi:hypothetical protein